LAVGFGVVDGVGDEVWVGVAVGDGEGDGDEEAVGRVDAAAVGPAVVVAPVPPVGSGVEAAVTAGVGLTWATPDAGSVGASGTTVASSMPPRVATNPIDSTNAPRTAMAEAAIAGETDGRAVIFGVTGATAAAPRR